MNLQQEVAAKLLQIKAIKLSPQEPFTWASGILSPIYCDNRIALSYPEARQLIIDGFVKESAMYQDFDMIAGVATAGIAHGALLADRLNLPFAYVRSKAKQHGRQNQIEGYLPDGAKVLVIEDLISTGGSSLLAVEALREAGAKVKGVMAIFSYQFASAEEAFQKVNCPFSTLSNYSALLEAAVSSNYISSSDLSLLKKWRSAPKEWSPEVR